MNPENLSPEEQEQYDAFLQEFKKNVDPIDYMPPSVREVAGLKFEFPVGKCATIFGRRGGSGEAVEGGS